MTERRLENKVVFITGGAGGIGSEMARLFASQGASVAIVDLKQEQAEVLASQIMQCGGKAVAIGCDISDSEQVDRALRKTVDSFGGLDALINNAATVEGDGTLSNVEEETFDHVVRICLKGTYLCTRKALSLLEARGGGSITSISSVNALFGLGHTAYTACKGGVISMMRLVAAEYGDRNIRANLICPGTIGTKTALDVWNATPSSFEILKAMYPLGRIGTPRDVAHCAMFLTSDEASFITGGIYLVDGGLLAGRKFDF